MDGSKHELDRIKYTHSQMIENLQNVRKAIQVCCFHVLLHNLGIVKIMDKKLKSGAIRLKWWGSTRVSYDRYMAQLIFSQYIIH